MQVYIFARNVYACNPVLLVRAYSQNTIFQKIEPIINEPQAVLHLLAHIESIVAGAAVYKDVTNWKQRFLYQIQSICRVEWITPSSGLLFILCFSLCVWFVVFFLLIYLDSVLSLFGRASLLFFIPATVILCFRSSCAAAGGSSSPFLFFFLLVARPLLLCAILALFLLFISRALFSPPNRSTRILSARFNDGTNYLETAVYIRSIPLSTFAHRRSAI